jgi:hypothetical protein
MEHNLYVKYLDVERFVVQYLYIKRLDLEGGAS